MARRSAVPSSLGKNCPCCGRPFAPALFVSGFNRRVLLDIVARRPDGIPTAELHSLLYAADPNGGPGLKTIHALVWHANKQLRPQGYEIKTPWRGRGARYVLVKLEDDNADPKHKPPGDPDARQVEGPEPAGPSWIDRRSRRMVERESLRDR
jgi:hypothetical protein